jgi:rhodanese-related sulfurtransferase
MHYITKTNKLIIQTISPLDFEWDIQENPNDYKLLDVRPREDYLQMHLVGKIFQFNLS